MRSVGLANYRLNLWVFPLTLGTGKKIFDGGTVPANLELLEPPATSSTGAVLLRYGLAADVPQTGDMRRADRGLAQEGGAAAPPPDRRRASQTWVGSAPTRPATSGGNATSRRW